MKAEINTSRLSSLRKEEGLTQQEAAAKIGVSQPAYQRYEAGTRIPSVQVIQQIAAAFHTSADYLLGKCDRKDADQLTITRADSPLVFECIERCNKLDDAQLKRLLVYMDQLKENTP